MMAVRYESFTLPVLSPVYMYLVAILMFLWCFGLCCVAQYDFFSYPLFLFTNFLQNPIDIS